MKLASCAVFVFFKNYSASFSNDDFSSFTNSTKEARLLRNEEIKINLSQLIIQIYKLSLTAGQKLELRKPTAISFTSFHR